MHEYREFTFKNWMTDLVEAGDIKQVQAALNSGYKIEQQDVSLLGYAVSANQTEMVNFLISKGADVNFTTPYTRSPLARAAVTGNVEIAKILMAHGAKVEHIQGGGDCTPLHEAAEAGHLEMVKLFVATGIDVNINSGGAVPIKSIVCAAEGGHTEVVKFLVNHGATLKTFDPNASPDLPILEGAFETSVLLVGILSKDVSLINFLLENKADPNLGLTAAHFDAIKGTPLNYLNYSDVNASDALGLKPVHYAIFTDHDYMLNVLATSGADIKAPIKFSEEDFMPLLHMAVGIESPKSAKFLLEHGANVNDVDSEGESALHFAIEAEGALTESMINLLIEHGANVNLADNFGNTPLHSAVYLGNAEAIKVLLVHGADASIKNSNGQDPLEIAQEYAKYSHHSDCVDAFLSNAIQTEKILTMEDVFSSQESDFMPHLERIEVQQNYTQHELNTSTAIEYF